MDLFCNLCMDSKMFTILEDFYVVKSESSARMNVSYDIFVLCMQITSFAFPTSISVDTCTSIWANAPPTIETRFTTNGYLKM